jgi:hypothetical protein
MRACVFGRGNERTSTVGAPGNTSAAVTVDHAAAAGVPQPPVANLMLAVVCQLLSRLMFLDILYCIQKQKVVRMCVGVMTAYVYMVSISSS